jgi:hypothetical protein
MIPGRPPPQRDLPAPIEPKAVTMPANDGIWVGNKRTSAQRGHMQRQNNRWLAFEHDELLAENEDFQGGIGSRTEEYRDCTQHSDEELDHEILVLTQRAARSIGLPGAFSTH